MWLTGLTGLLHACVVRQLIQLHDLLSLSMVLHLRVLFMLHVCGVQCLRLIQMHAFLLISLDMRGWMLRQ